VSTKKASEVASTRPAWFTTLLHTFEASESHVFLLQGGVSDYVTPQYPVIRYLEKAMSGPFEVVLTVSVDRGITFAQPHMMAKFLDAVGAEFPEGEAPKPGDPIQMAPLPMVALVLKFLRTAPPQTACALIERLDFFVGTEMPLDGNMVELIALLHHAGTDSALESRGNPLIMLTPSRTKVRTDAVDMASGIRAIDIPLPNYDARLTFINQRLASEQEVTLTGIVESQLAALTASLYRRHIENIILRARAGDGKLTRGLAREVQHEMMDTEYGSVMSRIDNDTKLAHVGGHVEAKAFFEHRVVNALKSGQFDIVPQNVLLVGPSGTGKTLLANAVANESGINCLLVDLSQFLEGVVGGTEAKLAKWKEGVLASAPCIVVMDEIDQKMRRGAGGSDPGGGGSVENRLFSFMLEFFGDPKNKQRGIVGLFMSNRPKLLDDALLSRCEVIIPILPAESDPARAAILSAIMLRSGLDVKADEPWLLEQAARVVDWSGRDLEQVVTEAIALHKLDNLTVAQAVSDAITYRRPATQDVRAQVQQALDTCNNLRLMPEKYRQQAQSKSKPAAEQPGDAAPRQRRVSIETHFDDE